MFDSLESLHQLAEHSHSVLLNVKDFLEDEISYLRCDVVFTRCTNFKCGFKGKKSIKVNR